MSVSEKLAYLTQQREEQINRPIFARHFSKPNGIY